MQNWDVALALLRTVPYLQELEEPILRALLAVASRREYESGQMIFNEGEPTAGLFFIEQGRVKISRFSAEGREHILHILESGDSFNDVSVLDGGPNPATAIAFDDASVWHISRGALHGLADQHPALAWALIENVAKRARFLVGLIEDLSMRTVKGRLARLLLEQAKANQSDELARDLTHEEMASHLGTVREMIGRALNSLAAARIIEIERHRIKIVDVERLTQEAEV